MKPGTDNTPLLSTRLLRSVGVLPHGAATAGEMVWPGGGVRPLLTARWRLALAPPAPGAEGVLDLLLSAPDVPEAHQRIVLRWTWWGWRFVEPASGTMTCRLHCPIGEPLFFASWQTHGLVHPSDREHVNKRPIRRLQRLQLRLAEAPASNRTKIEHLISEMELPTLLDIAARKRRKRRQRRSDEDAAMPVRSP